MSVWQPDAPLLGVCYYPEHWPRSTWADDARRMHQAGIRLVRIGEFAWSRLEPEPGRLELDWLDEALETLAAARLQVVMCTPTATPPRWLVERMPDMLAIDEHGRPRRFGSRRHYCFSHGGYREECRRITGIVARRFGRHPAVVAWQTDNEYGCHDTVLSYSAAATRGFRAWLEARYGTIESLNRAWGNVFWSMDYGGFDEIDTPFGTVTEANPAHRLDFQRYSSDAVADFNRLQCTLLRELSPGRALMHNYMGRFAGFDHRGVAADLDVAGWDSYPLGFLQRLQADRPDSERLGRYLRCGDPDFQAFHHDLYRGVGAGRLWVVEQQPGPVNWARSNPTPLPGAVRLWGLEAAAHGAEVVSYFRWRQAPFAQEQMHAGLMLPDGTPAPGLDEVRRLADDLAALALAPPTPAPVALLHDYEAQWRSAIQPQSADYDHFRLLLDLYRALRRVGADVDVIGRDASLAGYRLVLAPGLEHVDDALGERLAAFEGVLLVGPRTGARSESYSIAQGLPPGPLGDLAGVRVTRVDSLPRTRAEPLEWRGRRYTASVWREEARSTGAEPEAVCADGLVALWRLGQVHYLAVWPDERLARDLAASLLTEAGVATATLPEGLRTRTRGSKRLFFNYGPEAVEVPRPWAELPFVLGGPRVPPAGVAAVDES